jgi:hypothetical protein
MWSCENTQNNRQIKRLWKSIGARFSAVTAGTIPWVNDCDNKYDVLPICPIFGGSLGAAVIPSGTTAPLTTWLSRSLN